MADDRLFVRRVNEPFRFSLMHAFVLLTLACLYCAVVRSFGHFLALLYLAAIINFAILRIICIRGLIIGSFAGAVLAAGLTVVCALVCGVQGSGQFMMALFVAPTLGYLMGMTVSAREQCRLGI